MTVADGVPQTGTILKTGVTFTYATNSRSAPTSTSSTPAR